MLDIRNCDCGVIKEREMRAAKSFKKHVSIQNYVTTVLDKWIKRLAQEDRNGLDPASVEIENWSRFQWRLVDLCPDSEATNTKLPNA